MMKPLLLAIFLLMLCVGARAQNDSLSDHAKVLVGLPTLKVSVFNLNADAEADGLTVTALTALAQDRLKNAKIGYVAADSAVTTLSLLCVRVSTVKTSTDLYAYSIDVFVQDRVDLRRKLALASFAYIWDKGEIGISPSASMSNSVTFAVGVCIDGFIEDYTAANPAPSGRVTVPDTSPNLVPPPPPPPAPKSVLRNPFAGRPYIPTQKEMNAVFSSSAAVVWVNTATHTFHLPGSRWYGKTKRGKYLPKSDALKAGYRPAANGQ